MTQIDKLYLHTLRSFDPALEVKRIKCDDVAFSLMASQINHDILSQNWVLSIEDQMKLDEAVDPRFTCYKQVFLI